jgi:trimeric autotransporter adhesin
MTIFRQSLRMVGLNPGKIFWYSESAVTGQFLLPHHSVFRGGKIMSSISGIDSNNLLNALCNSLNKSTSSDTAQSTESESTATQQTTADSTSESKISLSDQLKIASLQNQCSLMASLLNGDDSASSDSLNSFWGADATTNNSQIDQLLSELNSSSSSSSETNDLITSLVQSLGDSDSAQSNSTSIQTVIENLLKSSGSTDNSSALEALSKYLSSLSDTSSLIKTTV